MAEIFSAAALLMNWLIETLFSLASFFIFYATIPAISRFFHGIILLDIPQVTEQKTLYEKYCITIVKLICLKHNMVSYAIPLPKAGAKRRR